MNVPIYHRYTLGVSGERFFKASAGPAADSSLTLVPSVKTCMLPPKMYCERCFEETSDEWVPR